MEGAVLETRREYDGEEWPVDQDFAFHETSNPHPNLELLGTSYCAVIQTDDFAEESLNKQFRRAAPGLGASEIAPITRLSFDWGTCLATEAANGPLTIFFVSPGRTANASGYLTPDLVDILFLWFKCRELMTVTDDAGPTAKTLASELRKVYLFPKSRSDSELEEARALFSTFHETKHLLADTEISFEGALNGTPSQWRETKLFERFCLAQNQAAATLKYLEQQNWIYNTEAEAKERESRRQQSLQLFLGALVVFDFLQVFQEGLPKFSRIILILLLTPTLAWLCFVAVHPASPDRARNFLLKSAVFLQQDRRKIPFAMAILLAIALFLVAVMWQNPKEGNELPNPRPKTQDALETSK